MPDRTAELDKMNGHEAIISLTAEFPAWVFWKSADGLTYARPKDKLPSSGHTVRGEDAPDLRDQIIRAESLAEDGLA
jgi:hypothetical protein